MNNKKRHTKISVRSESFLEYKTSGNQRLMYPAAISAEPAQMLVPGGTTTCLGCTCTSCCC